MCGANGKAPYVMAYYFAEKASYYSIAIANSSTRLYWQSGDSCLPRSQQFPQHMCSAQWECRMRRRPARHYSRRPKNLFILPSSYAHVMGSKRYCVASCIVSIMSGEQLRLVRKDQHKNGRDMDQVEGVEGTGFTWHCAVTAITLPSGGAQVKFKMIQI